MNISTPEHTLRWRIAGFIAFVFIVALFQLISSQAGMRGVGVVMLVVAGVQLVKRRIPYGWEAQEPSGYITGVPAVMVGLLMGAAGILMFAQPALMLFIFGWGDN